METHLIPLFSYLGWIMGLITRGLAVYRGMDQIINEISGSRILPV